jgi:hypothetical protein
MSPRALSIIFWLAITLAPAMAEVRISDDSGGQIGEYLQKLDKLRASGERVVIDGTCASACTMILGRIPRNRICVTPGAVLEFHSAWDPTPSGGQEINRDGNRILWSTYPEYIRRWIAQRGGLNSHVLYLRGSDLNAIYPTCH